MQQWYTKKPSGMDPPVRHDNCMQSLLGYHKVQGGGVTGTQPSTTYHVAMVFGKPLKHDQVLIEYAARLKMLARMLGVDLLPYRPSLVCFTNGGGGRATKVAGVSRGDLL
jgi:hypothetical protein